MSADEFRDLAQRHEYDPRGVGGSFSGPNSTMSCDGDTVELTPRGRRDVQFWAPAFRDGGGGGVSGAQGEADGFDAMVGVGERAVGGGRTEIALVAGSRHFNPAGVVHGGAIATLVDVAIGKAVGSLGAGAACSRSSRPRGQDEDGETLAEAMGTFTSTGSPAGQGS